MTISLKIVYSVLEFILALPEIRNPNKKVNNRQTENTANQTSGQSFSHGCVFKYFELWKERFIEHSCVKLLDKMENFYNVYCFYCSVYIPSESNQRHLIKILYGKQKNIMER